MFGASLISSCENGADFQDFSGCINSLASTCLVSNNYQPTRYNIKCLLKLDIQVDFRDISSHKKGILINV